MDLEQTYVLRLQTVQSTVIKTLCDVLKETLNDINFIFDETGMRVMAMDGSHVALVHLKLMSKNFEQYFCQKRVQVGLNMSHLFKIIKTVTTMDYITFFVKTDNQHEFGIQIENADKNTCTTFHLKMLDID